MSASDLMVAEGLSIEEVEAVQSLAELRSRSQRREALTEQALSRVATSQGIDHFLLWDDGQLTGYAQATTASECYEIEFLSDRVDDQVLTTAASRAEQLAKPLALWIHGRSVDMAPPVDGRLDRTVVRLVRPLAETEPLPAIDPEVSIRAFEASRDASAWIALNSRAFEHHPEQGLIDLDALVKRMEQPWFDPSGFFLAEQAARLVGFSWTKVHRDPWGSVGEIYVIGVDPAFGGRGIGRVLLSVSFHHLAQLGLGSVMLYCELDNDPAMNLYARSGFTEEWRDERWVLRR